MAVVDFKLTKEEDWKVLDVATAKHLDCFEAIQEKLNQQSHAERFIFEVLNDFNYEMVDEVCNDPDYQIGTYWNGSVKDYANQIQWEVNNARYVVINLYTCYIKNKAEIDSIDVDYISDDSMEYYCEIGPEDLCTDYYKWADTLTSNQINDLNRILVKTGFEPLAVQVQ